MNNRWAEQRFVEVIALFEAQRTLGVSVPERIRRAGLDSRETLKGA